MSTILSINDPIPNISIGVEECLVQYVRYYGPIVSLDSWAHEWNLTPDWVRKCAHSAAKKGLVKLTRLDDKAGKPYQVSLEEKNE